ncbi:MAG: lytic transglycosylase domain-containing protein [Desulfuromonadales bacterium]|nr:lytic transglycosylase domain-containing protein [Desulfuromonadales bacterium]
MSFLINKLLPPTIPLRADMTPGLSPVQSSMREADFGKLFETAMGASSVQAATKAAAPALSKEEVAAILTGIRRQMNLEMLKIINNDDPGEAGESSTKLAMKLLERLDPTLQASKYRQEQTLTPFMTSPADLNRMIEGAARQFNIEPKLIRSVIQAESGFNVRAVSPKGAQGLMQLMPGTARDLGVKDPFDPQENITGGARYLRILLDRYEGDLTTTLAAYNWGMGNVERNRGADLPQETQVYIRQVTKYLEEKRG